MKTTQALLLGATLLAAGAVWAQNDKSLEAGGTFAFTKPGDGARSYLRTLRSDYAKESFQAEATVTLKGGGGAGCAFFGMGCGQGNAKQYQEPSTTPSLFVRLAPSDFSGGVVTANVNSHENGHGSAPVGDGTHRVRFTWDSAGKRALFEIDANWEGQSFRADSSVTISATEVDFGNEARVFVGGANGVKFSEFSTKPLSIAEVKAAGFGESFTNDPTARTWLPVGALVISPTSEVADLLKSLRANMRLLGCWYAGSKLAASRPFANGEMSTSSTKWNCAVRTQSIADEKDALDVMVTFKLSEGVAKSAGVAVAFDFADWSTNNYVLIPAAVYNGNRYRTVGRGYATGLDPGDYYRKDLPLTQTVVPRLEVETGRPSKLEVNSCNVTTPGICVFDRKARRGFIVLAEQAGRDAQENFLCKPANGELLDNAFAVEESADRSHATMVVSAPGVRESKPEFIGFSASPDRGIAMKAGDVVRLKLRVYSFEAPDIPGLLERFMIARKTVTGPNHPRCLVPASQVEKWMTERIDSRFHNSPPAKFYCPENAPWIAFGWVGGWMNTFPMLVLGDEKHLERVSQTFDYGLKAQEPSGFFHYAIHANGSVTFRDPGPDMNMARTSGDMLFWMLKQFQLLKAQGRGQAIKPDWEASMKKLAEALMSTWKKDGQWGKLINVKTGIVAEYNTTGGATIIGALALASDYFNNPEYLTVAKEAAEFYYVRDFVTLGHTTGGCADILQNADSETAAGFMTSLMALYEISGDKQWLEKSRNLANLVATWTVSHDYQLPKTTELGGLGAKLAGVYWASTQNKHGAPGICTSSGDALFKIYRTTGNTRYAELLRDIVAAHGESIRPGGFTNERLTFCDADSRGSRGDHVTGWNELNGILMAMELPGIYLRTDKDEVFVFDHVEARVVKRDASGVTLSITNPTKFSAAISVFAEAASQTRQPLGILGFLKWPKVEVKAGETKTVQITPAGQIQ